MQIITSLSNKKQWLLTFFNIRKTSIGVRTSENSSSATGTARYPTAFYLRVWKIRKFGDDTHFLDLTRKKRLHLQEAKIQEDELKKF